MQRTIKQFKPLYYFADKGMLSYQCQWNDGFYDHFAGRAVEVAIIEDGIIEDGIYIEHIGGPIDPDCFEPGCEYCNEGLLLLSSCGTLEVNITEGELAMYDRDKEQDLEDRIDINFCPVCGRKLKADEL